MLQTIWKLTFLFALCATLFGCKSDAADDSSQTDASSNQGDSMSDSDALEPLPGAVELYESDAVETCPAKYQEKPDSGQHDNYPAEDQERSFYLQLPDAMAFTGPRPLVILFNGTSGNGLKAFTNYNGSDFLKAGFIVLAPDSIGNGTIWPVWDAARTEDEQELPNKDLVFVDSLLNCIAGHHEIDKNRIYVAGHSAGGIMANHILQQRSHLLAGGIVASGVFDFTSPIPAKTLTPMVVSVMWGGDNDIWGGDADRGDINVPEFNFSEQAAIASSFYAGAKDTRQVWVKGRGLGHAWVGEAGPMLIDFLLAHPKGYQESEWSLPDISEDASYTAGEEIVQFEPSIKVECTDDQSSCYGYCQLMADCAVENSTVGPVLGPQMTALGFTGENYTECGGCLEQCAASQTGDADEAVLTCFENGAKAATCSGGVSGVMPLVDLVNQCCEGHAEDSGVCQLLCGSIMTNSVVVQTGLFPSCVPYAAETRETEEAEGAEEGEEADAPEE